MGPENGDRSAFDVVIVGGGIHGVGLLHDLTSRGMSNCILVEKGRLGGATSSSSTKLIHGGLRYLANMGDFPLVHGALRERKFLCEMIPDLVKPIELILPILLKGGFPSWKAAAGLTLYDALAGKKNLHRHKVVTRDYVEAGAPILQTSLFKKFYSFWDAQTDDQGLVQRVAESARMNGGKIREHSEVNSVEAVNGGWKVGISFNGVQEHVRSKFLAVCAGPWTGSFLSRFGIVTQYEGFNDKGSHILVKNLGLRCGLFLQSPEDGRIFFVLPWMGQTLIGTTETEFSGDPDRLKPSSEDIGYLLERANRYIRAPIGENDILAAFSGLRWLPKGRKHDGNISAVSREAIIDEALIGSSKIVTLFGGKLTTYRILCREIGDRIAAHFGMAGSLSRTHLSSSWAQSSRPASSWQERFGIYGQ
jgi:glycerol-3-phosphate dehydrogenase